MPRNKVWRAFFSIDGARSFCFRLDSLPTRMPTPVFLTCQCLKGEWTTSSIVSNSMCMITTAKDMHVGKTEVATSSPTTVPPTCVRKDAKTFYPFYPKRRPKQRGLPAFRNTQEVKMFIWTRQNSVRVHILDKATNEQTVNYKKTVKICRSLCLKQNELKFVNFRECLLFRNQNTQEVKVRTHFIWTRRNSVQLFGT